MLGITRTAQDIDIKKAFHNLAKKYHPDVTKGNEAKFKEINEAYTVLSHQQTKRQYDGQSASVSSQQSTKSRGYSAYRPSKSASGQGFTGYGRSSSSSRSTNQQSDGYHHYYSYNDPNIRGTQESRNFQQQVIREFLKVHKTRQSNNTYNYQRRNDSQDFTQKPNTNNGFRNIYDENPHRQQSNSQEYTRSQQRYTQQEIDRILHQRGNQLRRRKHQYEQYMKQQKLKDQTLNTWKEDIVKVTAKVVDKASNVANKAWNWFTKK